MIHLGKHAEVPIALYQSGVSDKAFYWPAVGHDAPAASGHTSLVKDRLTTPGSIRVKTPEGALYVIWTKRSIPFPSRPFSKSLLGGFGLRWKVIVQTSATTRPFRLARTVLVERCHGKEAAMRRASEVRDEIQNGRLSFPE